MASLLTFASCIEAAVASYVSVKPVPNLEEWRRRFEMLQDDATREWRRLKSMNGGESPALHPSLAALYIVLKSKDDFSEIGRNHPNLKKHKFYQPHVAFAKNITHLLPPSGDRWWELLAAEARRRKRASEKQRRVNLILGPDPKELQEDVDMGEAEDEVDELLHDDWTPPTESRKRKGASLSEPGDVKRHASSRQHSRSNEGSDEVISDTVADYADYKFECDRCVGAKVECHVDALHPCRRCTVRKQRCSLMPFNEKTGKVDRSKTKASDILKYRLEQQQKRSGKKPDRRRRKGRGTPASGASPQMKQLSLDTGSPHSPVAASESSGPAPADFPVPAAATDLSSPPFYVEVPALLKRTCRPLVTQQVAAISPVPTITLTPTLTPPTATGASASNTAPIPASTTVSITPSTTHISAAETILAAAESSAATDLQSTPGPSRSPAVAPALRRFLAQDKFAPQPVLAGSPSGVSPLSSITTSHRQRTDASTDQGQAPKSDFADRIAFLERRMDAFEERLTKAGL